MGQALLERWLAEVVATPGLTAFTDPDEARAMLAEDALRAVTLLDLAEGPVVDVGSGGGSPGIPLAIAAPERLFTLLEAERRKADRLAELARDLPNVGVVWGRAELEPIERYGVALAKALAKPPVAAELTLPLVRTGGAAIVWLGESADRGRLAAAAGVVGGELESERDGLAVLRKTSPTPSRFPRRSGMAKKRPLA